MGLTLSPATGDVIIAILTVMGASAAGLLLSVLWRVLSDRRKAARKQGTQTRNKE